MSNESDARLDTHLQSIDHSTLTPLVRQALGSETAEVIGWDYQQIHGGGGMISSIYRLSGDGRDQRKTVPWSLILKMIRFVPDRDDPSGWGYWKREVLAYQSGLLDDLPCGLVAPRCFDVIEQTHGESWIWMEDVKDEIGPEWPLEYYGVVARHLGQFNGAYLARRPVPSQTWLSKEWLRKYVAYWGTRAIPRLHDSLEHPLVRRAFPPDVANGLFRLWAERDTLLDALGRLPQTFCHMDAFRRNLFARRGPDSSHQTLAIDWADAGIGAIGQDIVPLVSGSLILREVEWAKASELDRIVFDGYLAGLCDAGWCGDSRVLRFGYSAASALHYCFGNLHFSLEYALNESSRAGWEREHGCSAREAMDKRGQAPPFLLGLANEARELLGALS